MSILLPVLLATSLFGPFDIHSLFSIGQSIDRDEVHYGIHLDSQCRPDGKDAVFPYWRRADKTIENLGVVDQAIYGIKEQTPMPAAEGESKLLVTLKATSERSVAVFVKKENGSCVARSIATIDHKPAELVSVYAHVGGILAGVDWIELRGTFEGKPIVERVRR